MSAPPGLKRFLWRIKFDEQQEIGVGVFMPSVECKASINYLRGLGYVTWLNAKQFTNNLEGPITGTGATMKLPSFE